METIALQIASLYGINVNSTRDLLPAIFMKAFADSTVRLFFFLALSLTSQSTGMLAWGKQRVLSREPSEPSPRQPDYHLPGDRLPLESS